MHRARGGPTPPDRRLMDRVGGSAPERALIPRALLDGTHRGHTQHGPAEVTDRQCAAGWVWMRDSLVLGGRTGVELPDPPRYAHASQRHRAPRGGWDVSPRTRRTSRRRAVEVAAGSPRASSMIAGPVAPVHVSIVTSVTVETADRPARRPAFLGSALACGHDGDHGWRVLISCERASGGTSPFHDLTR